MLARIEAFLDLAGSVEVPAAKRNVSCNEVVRRTRKARAAAGRRRQIADALRSLVAFGSVVCIDPALLLRAAEVYETHRPDFAEAYLVRRAESTGVAKIASFDRSLNRVQSIERVEPPEI